MPGVLALATLVAARLLYPRPGKLEAVTPPLTTQGFPSAFWLYLAAVALVAAGYADFPLITFHFQKEAIVRGSLIPLYSAVAMATDALAASLFGRLFDRIGLGILMVVSLLSALFAPLVFPGGAPLVLAGVALWGVGLGAQESIMRAAIGPMVARQRRGRCMGFSTPGRERCRIRGRDQGGSWRPELDRWPPFAGWYPLDGGMTRRKGGH